MRVCSQVAWLPCAWQRRAQHSGMDMYLDFYRLQRAPFPLTPDPTLFFVSPSHHAALDALTQGIATRQGLVVITGASGVGKTALVHAYLALSAAPQLTTLVLWQAPLSLMDLLALMARRLEVPVAPDDLGALRTHMQQRFLHEAHLGRNVALIIDEAQHLPLETLEQVWELAHPPATRALPLQIVLVGQPALQQHLQGRYLHQVAQGIGLHATLGPLTAAESLAYIRQHVAKVALPGGPIFTPGALQALVRQAQGVPRVLNRLCTDVLQAGCWAQQQPITEKLVQQVIAVSPGGKAYARGRRGLAVTAGLVLAASLLWVAPFRPWLQAGLSRPAVRVQPASEEARPSSAPPPAAPPLPQPEPAPQARPASTPGSALSPAPGGSVERQRLEPPPAPLIPSALPPRPARPPARPQDPPRQRTQHVVPSPHASANTPSPHGERPPAPAPPSPPPSLQGYTLMRRIYCDNLTSGVLHGSTDLKVMSPLSCEEAHNILLVWEQQKDHCQVVDTTLRESHHKAKAWIGTPSCPMP